MEDGSIDGWARIPPAFLTLFWEPVWSLVLCPGINHLVGVGNTGTSGTVIGVAGVPSGKPQNTSGSFFSLQSFECPSGWMHRRWLASGGTAVILTGNVGRPTVNYMGDKRINWTRDEIILACDLVWANGWRALDASRTEVLELSELLRQSPLHPPEGRPATFRNPAGVGRKTSDIATHHPDYTKKRTRGNRIDRDVLEDFLARPTEMHQIAGRIRKIIQDGAVVHSDLGVLEGFLEEELEAPEGRLLRSWQVKRERDPKLRMRKIQQVKQQGEPVACSVCSFDFYVAYGDRGRDYIEVHHILPLHVSGETKTGLGDLALLCSNCHRMIHRGPWLTPSKLQELYASSPPLS